MTRSPFAAIRSCTLALVSARAAGKTVCPSEVARAVVRERDGSDVRWRDAMAEVHAAIDEMVAADEIRLSWKGERLDERSGPYRIRVKS